MNDIKEIRDKLLDGLTEPQKQAVQEITHDLEIVACAGAGKTKTVTHRIIYMIANGVKPENIVAITFTRKAAAEMRGRIYDVGGRILGNTKGFADMYIGTIDAFCLKMLQEYEPEYAKFSVLDEVQTKIFLERFSGGREDLTGLRGSVIDRAVNLNRNGSKNPRKFDYYSSLMSMLNSTWHDHSYRDNWSPEVLDCLDRYNKCLYDNKYFDFSSMIRKMIEGLDPESDTNGGQISEFGQKVFDRVKYLIIDEYQDTNPSQEYLTGLFKRYGNANLCVVGDADQTIYQFRGSDESNILGFKEKYDAVQIRLDKDFRSTDAVIDVANHSIEGNYTDGNKHIPMVHGEIKGSSLAYEEGDIVWKDFAGYDSEADHMVREIKRLNDSGIPLSEIAVLFRRRREYNFGVVMADFQSVLASKLKENNIEYIVEGLNTLHTTDEFAAMEHLFFYITATYLPKYSNMIIGFQAQQIKDAWLKVSNDESCYEAAIKDLDKKMKKICSKEKVFGHEFNMQQIFQEFLAHFDFLERDDNRARTTMYNFGKCSRVIADFELLYFNESAQYKAGQFCEHLMLMVTDLYPEGEQDNAMIRGDAVRLMTVHQSKGMEFTAVFIPALCEGIFPSGSFSMPGRIYSAADALSSMAQSARQDVHSWVPNYNGYYGGVDAERKLFYVAVTRAKKYLFLSYAEKYGDKDECRSEFLNEVLESPYLKYYKCLGDNPDFRYSDKALPFMKQDPLPLTLNFSLLSNYYDCPYRFKLSNFYGFVQPYSEVQGYGTVLHEIMMHIHRTWIDHEEITEDNLKQIVETAVYLPFANPVQIENAKTGAMNCAKAYIKQNEKDKDRMVASEMDINIEMGEGVSVNGRIDLVRTVQVDGSEKLAIVDLKSAGKDAEQCLNAEQLKIYAIGYQEATGRDADYLMIYNLDHPDGSRNAKEEVQSNALISARDGIMEAAHNIRSDNLPRKKGEKCKGCYLKHLCGKKN